LDSSVFEQTEFALCTPVAGAGGLAQQILPDAPITGIAALAAQTGAQVSYYGVSRDLREFFPTDEELYGGPVHHSEQQTSAELLRLPGAETPLRMRIGATEHDIDLRAEGPHNAQNATGALH